MYPYIKIFNFNIPSYGLCTCIAVFLCATLVFKKARKLNVNLNDLLILIAVSIGCGMLGGSLLYIIVTYDFNILCKHVLAGNLFFLENPGTVFYGGIIAGTLGGITTARMLKIKVEPIEICIVPYIPLGHAIGRIGCLLAGCCYGFNYSGIFAVTTRFSPENATYFPIQIIEALFNLIIMGVLLIFTKKKRFKYSIILFYLIMYSFLRFSLEFFRGDVIRGSFLFFSTSQWLSLMILLSCLIVIQKNRKRGM